MTEMHSNGATPLPDTTQFRQRPAFAAGQSQRALAALLEDFRNGGLGISSEAFRDDFGITDIPTRIFELRYEQSPQGWPIETRMGRARNGFTKVAVYRLTDDKPSTDPKYRFRFKQKTLRFQTQVPANKSLGGE